MTLPAAWLQTRQRQKEKRWWELNYDVKCSMGIRWHYMFFPCANRQHRQKMREQLGRIEVATECKDAVVSAWMGLEFIVNRLTYIYKFSIRTSAETLKTNQPTNQQTNRTNELSYQQSPPKKTNNNHTPKNNNNNKQATNWISKYNLIQALNVLKWIQSGIV